jgi:hypothetical protein
MQKPYTPQPPLRLCEKNSYAPLLLCCFACKNLTPLSLLCASARKTLMPLCSFAALHAKTLRPFAPLQLCMQKRDLIRYYLKIPHFFAFSPPLPEKTMNSLYFSRQIWIK